MPQSWEVRRELLTERGFPRPGWRGDNEQNSPSIRRGPRLAGCRRRGAVLWWLSSFDVLDLFANAFQFGLHLDHMTGDFRIVGF